MKERAGAEAGASYLRLACHNTNTKALVLYTRMGFKPFDGKIIQDYEGNEIAAIQMEINL
ncbi:hypothetical protein [Paenibacillus lutrae]|uniref:hypothetical protein n=1 Tax=Paenibacillus lutrae TaxID=2078573 RepID=UPI001F477C6E|nr:hypothetical protein [Paenibacillus lutrae]